MRISRRSARFVPSAVLLLVLAACSKSTKAPPNPDFTYEKVVQGGFVLGGVSTLLKTVPDPLDYSNVASSALLNQLNRGRGDLTVKGWSGFRLSVGDSIALRCLTEYRDFAGLDSALVDTLIARLGSDSRYLIVARIERDYTNQTEKDAEESRGGETVKIGTRYITERYATVAFNVYDLSTGKWAWGTVIDGRAASERTERKPEETPESSGEKGFLDKALDAINVVEDIAGLFGGGSSGDAPRSPFPAPPDHVRALDAAYEVFAWQLPKEK